MVVDLGLSLWRLGGAAFSPLSLSPIAWYDPSDFSTLFQNSNGTTAVTADGDPVGYMADKSGNGHHLIQATAASRPLYKTSGGLRWLEFDGTDDFLAVSYGGNLTEPWEAVSALRRLSASNGHLIGGAGDNIGVLYINSSQLRIYSGAEVTGLAAPASGADFVATQRHNGASSRIAIDNGSYTAGDDGGTAATGLTVGAGVGGASDFSAMRFVGRALFSSLQTDPNLALLRTYLAAKQGRVL